MERAILEGLLARVVQYTRDGCGEHCLALYLYGSAATGRMDAWSDLDLLLIEPRQGAIPNFRDWWRGLRGLVGEWTRCDAALLCPAVMGPAGHWEIAPLVQALHDSGRLLDGQELRPHLPPVAPQKLRLAVAQGAGIWLRGLYGVPPDQPLPRRLGEPPFEPTLVRRDGRNDACLLLRAVGHLLRASLYLQDQRWCPHRLDLRPALVEAGPAAWVELFDTAEALRTRLNPRGPLAGLDADLQALRSAVPGLWTHLQELLARWDLADPSHEPGGQLLYDAQGHYAPSHST